MSLQLSTFIPIIKDIVYHISINDYASIERKGQKWEYPYRRSDLMLALSCYMNDGAEEVIIYDVYVP